jgi:hypothetical protein
LGGYDGVDDDIGDIDAYGEGLTEKKVEMESAGQYILPS